MAKRLAKKRMIAHNRDLYVSTTFRPEIGVVYKGIALTDDRGDVAVQIGCRIAKLSTWLTRDEEFIGKYIWHRLLPVSCAALKAWLAFLVVAFDYRPKDVNKRGQAKTRKSKTKRNSTA